MVWKNIFRSFLLIFVGLMGVLRGGVLHESANEGDLDVVKELIEEGADPHEYDKEGWLPLHFAASKGHFEVVKYLIDKGVSAGALTTGEKEKVSSYHMACMGSRLKMVKYFIEKCGVDPQSEGVIFSRQENSFLHLSPIGFALLAPKDDTLLLVRYLVKKKVPVPVEIKKTKPPKEDHLGLKKGVPNSFSYLHLVSQSGQLGLLKYLLEKHDGDVKKKHDGFTLMHYGAMSGNVALLKYLVTRDLSLTKGVKKASFNLPHPIQPFDFALRWGDEKKSLKVIKYLLSEGEVKTEVVRRGYDLLVEKGTRKVIAEYLGKYLKSQEDKDREEG